MAGPEHIEMLWNAIAGKAVSFSAATAIADYSAITGYVPGNESTDNGTDMVSAANYWKNTGFLDASSNTRHKIGAYLQIDAGNFDHVIAASYLFDGGVGLGINLPSSAEDQFSNGQPWDVVPGDSIEGGHYVPLISRDAAGMLGVVTWGQFQPMTLSFLTSHLTEAIAYVSADFLTNGESPEGFNLPALQADLEALA